MARYKNQLENAVRKSIAKIPKNYKFKPYLMHNKYGNMLIYMNADEAAIGETIDNRLTILRSAIDNRIIGIEIWDTSDMKIVGEDKNAKEKCKKAKKK